MKELKEFYCVYLLYLIQNPSDYSILNFAEMVNLNFNDLIDLYDELYAHEYICYESYLQIVTNKGKKYLKIIKCTMDCIEY